MPNTKWAFYILKVSISNNAHPWIVLIFYKYIEKLITCINIKIAATCLGSLCACAAQCDAAFSRTGTSCGGVGATLSRLRAGRVCGRVADRSVSDRYLVGLFFLCTPGERGLLCELRDGTVPRGVLTRRWVPYDRK